MKKAQLEANQKSSPDVTISKVDANKSQGLSQENDYSTLSNSETGRALDEIALTPNHILLLNNMIGNQAVGKLLQAKKKNEQLEGKKVAEVQEQELKMWRLQIQHQQLEEKDEIQNKQNKDLPKDIQTKMEASFDEDFSNVQIYKNSEDAKKLKARAFTQGNNIYFAEGEFNPISQDGQELLAHELSHVVQQRSGVVKGTHVENDYMVSNEKSLEAKADIEGHKAASGESVKSVKREAGQSSNVTSIQKKSQPIQMWRDVPGQIQVETTTPDTSGAWGTFMQAARQAGGKFANSAEPELRRLYYNLISTRLRGSFAPIDIDANTTNGLNYHWVGTIRFVFGDAEIPIPGGGTGTSTLSGGGGSSNSLETSSSSTSGSSGSAEGGYSQGEKGASGKATAGGSGSTSTGVKETQGDNSNAGSSSQITQKLNRYASAIGVEVNISASYDMGSSWTDWVNPATYSAWAGDAIADAISSSGGSGSANGVCGSLVYYKGEGIATTGGGG
ncbi:MAG: DUF4157 domain-containing protein [Chloroflexi bacterium]|nr:DUF4157 domain-containing protein [Chloroflexota bacterium]